MDLKLLYFKQEAVFSAHGPANFGNRHPLAFESHGPASMGKLLIPCDIIMQAFMAGDVHGCWVLVTGYWSLVTGSWLLVTCHWVLVTGEIGYQEFGSWNTASGP